MYLVSQLKDKRFHHKIYKDIFAGMIVALVSIPIAMGYASLAGLPAVYGLYGSLFPILIFGLFTTSPQFVVGVDAMPAVMVGGLLGQLSISLESNQAMDIVPLVSLLCAAWFLIFAAFRAGRIVKYISTPVMGGFISGVGLTIILMQIPKLFGGKPGTGEVLQLIAHIYGELSSFHFLSFLLGVGTVVIILLCKKLWPKLPMTIGMLFLGAALQMILHLDQYGVALLTSVDAGLPRIVLPHFSLLLQYPSQLLTESLSIAAVIMAQTLLATGGYAQKYDDKVDNNKELLAYAGMNVASSLVGCCPINGSVSRSGIADSFGCRSQMMSISSFVTMLFVLLFGTPYLKYLPVPILTGIVMTALIGILENKLMIRLWKSSRNEWLIFMMSFAGVLLLGTVNGVVIGCILSFAHVAIKATTPPTSFIGRIPGQGNFYPLDRNSNARAVKGIVIYRFSGNLFFANINKFISDIESAIKLDTKGIIVDARAVGSIDVTAVDRLLSFSRVLDEKGIRFYLTEHDGYLNDQLRVLGGETFIRAGNVRRTITLALRDMGMEKPYELEAVNAYFVHEKQMSVPETEPDERLAEMEWAFGKDAQFVFDQMALETIEHIEEVLAQDRLQTSWGFIGRFDENELWDYVEMRLEELADKGEVDERRLTELETRIEQRRVLGEEHLQQLNPHALDLLHKHRQRMRAKLMERNPQAYEHLKKQQELYYNKLKQKNPKLAESLARLHVEDKND